MEWQKRVEVPPLSRRWSRRDAITLWGSCFADELQRHLFRELYDCSPSPYGILYNPLSMAEGVERLLADRPVTLEELIEHEGLCHSPMHHGIFSAPTPEETLARIEGAWQVARERLATTKLWVFTFGTSYLYEWAEAPHVVVSNCHRLPAKCFRRRRAEVGEIVRRWLPLLEELTKGGAEVVLSVSPIPHYRDGAHESRLSKAVLLLALEQMVEQFPEVHYFPSYEIQLDELRDYRFFAEDMAHPSEAAVRYILSRFEEFALEKDLDFNQEWHALLKLAEHRPLSSNPERVAAHQEGVLRKLRQFAQQYPHPFLTSLIEKLEV